MKAISSIMVCILWVGVILDIISPFIWIKFYSVMYPKIQQLEGFEPIILVLLAMISLSIMTLSLIVSAGFLALYYKKGESK